MKSPVLLQILSSMVWISLLAVISTTTLFAGTEDTPVADGDQSVTSTIGDNQPPVLGPVGRDGAYGYYQSTGSNISFASSKQLSEEDMEEGLADFRSRMNAVWLYYSAEASDPEGDEVRYVWSQVSPEQPVAIIEQDNEFVPAGKAVIMKLCIPPSGAEIKLQVVAIDRSGAKSEPKSVVVNAAGCTSEAGWARLFRFAQLQEAANQGDYTAQEAFAYAYINGDGVFKSESKGTELMQMYAQAGNPEAQSEWAYFLNQGKHRVKKDSEEGLKWYRAAAEQGHAHAQYVMGLYEEDKKEALRWYTLAAEQSHSRAQFYLASMLVEGDGVPKDLAVAKEWMQKSADQGHERANTWIENWEVATAFDESGNRPPLLTSVTYTGVERPTSISYSADKMTYKDGKLVTEGGQSRANTIVWLKFTVQAEDFDAESIRYLVTQLSPDTPVASIGGGKGAFKYHASGNEVLFAACFPQISGGQFTFQVVAEDQRGAKSDPQTIVLDAIRSDRCP